MSGFEVDVDVLLQGGRRALQLADDVRSGVDTDTLGLRAAYGHDGLELAAARLRARWETGGRAMCAAAELLAVGLQLTAVAYGEADDGVATKRLLRRPR